jgi:hypothetical protein
MIDPGDIQEQLDKVPFEPFRMRLVNGVHYDVEHADSITLMDRYALFRSAKIRLVYSGLWRYRKLGEFA